MPYNVITETPSRRIRHVSTATEALALMADLGDEKDSVLVVSTDGVTLSPERLAVLAALETNPSDQAA